MIEHWLIHNCLVFQASMNAGACLVYHSSTIEAATTTSQNTSSETSHPIWLSLSFIQGVSELRGRHLCSFKFNLEQRPTKTLWRALVHVKDPLLTQRRWNVVSNFLCSECLSDYVGQIVNHTHEGTPKWCQATGREFNLDPSLSHSR